MSTISPENLRFASTILAIGIISSTDLTQPHYVLYCRIAFALTQAVFLLLCLYVYSKINEREDGAKIRVPNPTPFGTTPEPNDYTEMTSKEYDLDQLKKFVQQIVMSTLIISFLSYKMEVVPPLLFTFLSAPAQFLSTNIFRAYFLESNMERPFKEEPSAIMKLYQQYMAPTPEQQPQEVEGSANSGAIEGPGDDDSSNDEKEPETREDEPTQVSTPRLEEPTVEEPKVEDTKVEEPKIEQETPVARLSEEPPVEEPKVEDIYAHVAEVQEEVPKKKDDKKKMKGSDDDSSSSSSSSSSSEDEKSDKKEKKQKKKHKKNK